MDYIHKMIVHHYADFEGRASRDEFLPPTLLLITIMVPFFYLLMGMQMESSTSIYNLGLVILLGGIIIFTIIPMTALQTRRLHDTGKSGWWYLIGIIPYIGFFILVYLLTRPSEKGANIYGPSPEFNERDNSVL